MKGSKGSETKALIREAAFKQFLTKDYSMVPLKDIEKVLICLEVACHTIIQQNKNCLWMSLINTLYVSKMLIIK